MKSVFDFPSLFYCLHDLVGIRQRGDERHLLSRLSVSCLSFVGDSSDDRFFPWQCPPDIKKRVPAGPPLVAGHAGICNTIARQDTQRNGICQSHQIGIWFNVMICMNQFLHTQITIIAPRIGDASFDKRNHYESTTLELSHFKKRYNDFKEKPWFAQKKRIKPIISQKRIVYLPLNSFYQVLSAEFYTKHGLNVHGVIFDELHVQPNRALYDVMLHGSGDARKQPLFFLITTAGRIATRFVG